MIGVIIVLLLVAIPLFIMLGAVLGGVRRLEDEVQRLRDRVDALSEAPVAREPAVGSGEPAGTVGSMERATAVSRPAAAAVQPPPLPAMAGVVGVCPEPPLPEAAAPQPPPLPPPPLPATPAPCMAVAPQAASGPAAPETARSVLARMWNWLLVGDEAGTRGASLEYAVATTWLLRVGILAIVMFVAFFLKWSIDRKLLQPAARVLIGGAVGLGMMGWGAKLLARKYRAIGHGLLGGGLLALYLSVYAACLWYGLISFTLAGALMVAIVALAGVAAVVADSLLIAVLGLAGGYLTPVLLHTADTNLPMLYSYLLLLSVGILALSNRKPWRLLHYLGFAATYALFATSLESYTPAQYRLAMLFLTAFFVVHNSIAFLPIAIRSRHATVLEILHLALNAAVYAAFGYRLTREALGAPYPALVPVGLCAFLALEALTFFRRGEEDRKVQLSLATLAALAAVWSCALLLKGELLTLGLALLAALLLWVGRRVRCWFLQSLAASLYAVALGRFLVMGLPASYRSGAWVAELPAYWRVFWHRFWVFGATAGGFLAGAALAPARTGPAVNACELGGRDAEAPAGGSSRATAGLLYWAGVLVLFLFLQCELTAMFRHFPRFAPAALTALWCGMALYFAWRNRAQGGTNVRLAAAMGGFLLGAVLKLLGRDLSGWRLSEHYVYAGAYVPAVAAVRLLDFGLVVATCLAVWHTMRALGSQRRLAGLGGYAGLLLTVLYATLELNTILHGRLPAFQSGGITILWAAFGIVLVTCGIWRSVAGLRYLGLGLLFVVAWKAFVVDLAGMAVVYRVIAFLVVGVILMVASFAYVYASRKFQRENGATPAGGAPPAEVRDETRTETP